MGSTCEEWTRKFQDAHSAGSVHWNKMSVRGKTVLDLAAYLQMLTCSIFTGTVSGALWVDSPVREHVTGLTMCRSHGWIRLSPTADREFQNLNEDAKKAAASGEQIARRRLLDFMHELNDRSGCESTSNEDT